MAAVARKALTAFHSGSCPSLLLPQDPRSHRLRVFFARAGGCGDVRMRDAHSLLWLARESLGALTPFMEWSAPILSARSAPPTSSSATNVACGERQATGLEMQVASLPQDQEVS